MLQESSSSDSDSDSDSSSDTETSVEDDDDEVPAETSDQLLMQQLLQQQQLQQLQGLGQARLPAYNIPPPAHPLGGTGLKYRARAANRLRGLDATGLPKVRKEKKVKKKRGSKLEFKRVDQLWDSTIHNYKLTDTAEDEESSEYDQYLFNVRRTFDWEGKYKVG